MRRLILWLVLAFCLPAYHLQAGDGRVLKMLPFFLDHKYRHSLTPSLYDRDAYQFYLGNHPELHAGMKFAVQWKYKGNAQQLLLRLELRGIVENYVPKTMTIEKIVQPRGWFTNWDELLLVEEDYSRFGKVTAWRISLWETDAAGNSTLVNEQTSFLW